MELLTIKVSIFMHYLQKQFFFIFFLIRSSSSFYRAHFLYVYNRTFM